MISKTISQNRHGFTLVEIIVVIVIIAILAAVAIPALTGYIDKSHRAEDLISVRTLNMGTQLYSINEQIPMERVFDVDATNLDRQNTLLDGAYIEEIMVAKSKDADFLWEDSSKVWYLSGSSIPLTPLGSTFEEITPQMIDLLKNFPGFPNKTASTWGDRQYTDIGLVPEVWEDQPINHIIYKPVGNRLTIKPEDGYSFHFRFINGDSGNVTSRSNHVLAYDLKKEIWFHKSIDSGLEVDIDSLIVK